MTLEASKTQPRFVPPNHGGNGGMIVGGDIERPNSDSQDQVSQVQESAEGQGKNEKKLWTPLQVINFAVNLSASITNFLTFFNGNFNFSEAHHEKLETISTFLAKCGTGIQGFTNAISNFRLVNLLAAVGSAMEIPVAIFANGYNLWLSRGIAQGLSQYNAVMSRTPKLDNDQKQLLIGSEPQKYKHFKEEGFFGGAWITLKESWKQLKELPSKFADKKGRCPGFINLFSLFMIGGSLISFAGLYKIGAFIRDFGGGAVDCAFMIDPEREGKTKTVSSNGNPEKGGVSYLLLSGVIWIGAAIVDFLKRFDFFSKKVNNFTQLSLAFDRGASIPYVLDSRVKKEEE